MSVYQVNGRPLSQQALYQQKLRQGVYNSPGKPSVGVSSNASDAAALLAASSDLTVKPSYERLSAAPEAHNAALAVKRESVPAWSRDSTDPQADAAASSAKLLAPAPGPKQELGVPSSYNHGPLFRKASANSTSTMTSRTSPEKAVGKHGLATKSSTMTSAGLNIGRISQLADKNLSTLLNKRFNPENDYRLGVASQPAEFLTEDEERMAAQSAGRSLTMLHGSGYTNSVSSQRRTKTFQAADVVDATLLAAALAKANERLQSIRLSEPSDLRAQAQLYSKALATAQKNSEERLKSHKAGVIDMGGGLSLPISEVDKLAALIVQPVLDDLSAKAAAQRESDHNKQVKHTELVFLHQKARREDESRKLQEKAERERAKQERIQANEGRKTEEDEKYTAYQGERNGEVETKNGELAELQAKYATEKEALSKEKQENEERIETEETGLINGRKEELEGMQSERDELLRPTLEELEVETSKLKELTDSKNELTTEVQTVEKQNADYEAKIAELKAKLEATKASIETATTELEETTAKRETTDKEVEELQASSSAVFADSEATHKDLDGKLEQLEQERSDHIATKATHKETILLEIDDQVKDEHKINSELPEHLRLSIDETRFRDTGSLFSAEAKPEPVEEKVVAPAAAPAAPVAAPAPAAASPKKKGLRSRFSGIKNAFKTTPVKETKKAPATVSSTLRKETKPAPAAKPAVVSTRASSEVSNIDEDLSIKNSNRKSGVFKEEI